MKLCKPFALCVLAWICAPAWADKSDVVILKNGDKLTGEIEKLEAGLLEFSTDTMGTVHIEWRFIAQVISSTSQVVETIDGRRLLGSLKKPESGDAIIISSARGPVSVDPEQAVAVWPVAATLVDRMDLDLGLGIDYAKATDITDLNLSSDFHLLTTDRLTEASLRIDVTRQRGDDEDEQKRTEIRVSHQYLLAKQRFRAYFAGAEGNEALGVDLRLYAGAGLGKYFVKTNNRWLTLAAGLVATQENPEQENSETNIEGVGNVRFRYFRYADPERNFDTSLSVYPSLTNSGRWRADLRSTFKLEFIDDLYWSLEAYATHDSDPLTEGAETTDYGITSAVGYSF